jgi:hypothetical protein
MFLNQPQFPQFPTFYTMNDIQRKSEAIAIKTVDFNKSLVDNTLSFIDDITDKNFTTYTKKAFNFNQNVAEDAKKIIKSESVSENKGTKS